MQSEVSQWGGWLKSFSTTTTTKPSSHAWNVKPGIISSMYDYCWGHLLSATWEGLMISPNPVRLYRLTHHSTHIGKLRKSDPCHSLEESQDL